jgi:hypothetical protein
MSTFWLYKMTLGIIKALTGQSISPEENAAASQPVPAVKDRKVHPEEGNDNHVGSTEESIANFNMTSSHGQNENNCDNDFRHLNIHDASLLVV